MISAEAIVMQLHKPLIIGSLGNFMNAFVMLVNLYLGIHYARKKQFAQHKSAMAWLCAWTANPGMVRVSAYAMVYLTGGCNVEYLGGYLWGAAGLGLLCICPSAVLLKEVRTKLFLGNLFGIMLAIVGDVPVTARLLADGKWCAQ
jgi:hypothetical protein